VLQHTGALAGLAEIAVRDAQRVLVNAKRAIRRATARAAVLRARGERDAAAVGAAAGWYARSTT
jgi:IS5 family transposase